MPRTHSSSEPLTTFVDTQFETGLIRKGEHWRTEMIIPHVGDPIALKFSLAIYHLPNPNLNPSWSLDLSMEEARLLRDVLNRPEMQRYLEMLP